jgi:HlyD family secretion protein
VSSFKEQEVVLSAHSPHREPGEGESSLTERVQSLRLPVWPERGFAARGLIAWGLCFGLAVSTAVLGYLAFRRDPATPASTPVADAGPDKTVSDTVTNSGEIALESKGYLIPTHQILVSPKVSGMILDLKIQEGKRVEEGEVLATLEDIDYRADHLRAEALLASATERYAELKRGYRPEEISQARAELRETEAQLKQLKEEWDRNKILRQRNVMPQQDFEVTEGKYFAMFHHKDKLENSLKLMEQGPRIERIQAAAADVELAKAELAKAKWRWDNCMIRAPITGTILKKNAEKGNVVNPIAFNGSFSVCDMADLADMEVDLSIQERDIHAVFQGQKCSVCSDAHPKRRYYGEVSRIMPIADRAKGSISVRVKVRIPKEEEGVYLKPEMAVTVSFYKEGKGPPESGLIQPSSNAPTAASSLAQ